MAVLASDLNVVLITGGVGGAKLAEGLAALLPVEHLTMIGNVGDDDEFHGLWVSPDIDTLTYTLAGKVDREAGWGIAEDSFHTLAGLEQLGRDTWMRLGDKDMATHIYRNLRRQVGDCPSDIADDIASKLGVSTKILLPTDDRLQTRIQTPDGWSSMQEYFIRDQCRPLILGIEYSGATTARANPAALSAIEKADALIFAPSNPPMSIGPTLAIPSIYHSIVNCSAYRVAVSPLIAGQAVKGPTGVALNACGYSTNLLGIASYYYPLIDGLVIDQKDRHQTLNLKAIGLDCYCQNILMDGRDSRIAVAEELWNGLLSNIRNHQHIATRKKIYDRKD